MSAATLADRRGRRAAFVRGTVLYAAASALCGLPPALGVLTIGRGLQAVGADRRDLFHDTATLRFDAAAPRQRSAPSVRNAGETAVLPRNCD